MGVGPVGGGCCSADRGGGRPWRDHIARLEDAGVAGGLSLAGDHGVDESLVRSRRPRRRHHPVTAVGRRRVACHRMAWSSSRNGVLYSRAYATSSSGGRGRQDPSRGCPLEPPLARRGSRGRSRRGRPAHPPVRAADRRPLGTRRRPVAGHGIVEATKRLREAARPSSPTRRPRRAPARLAVDARQDLASRSSEPSGAGAGGSRCRGQWRRRSCTAAVHHRAVADRVAHTVNGPVRARLGARSPPSLDARGRTGWSTRRFIGSPQATHTAVAVDTPGQVRVPRSPWGMGGHHALGMEAHLARGARLPGCLDDLRRVLRSGLVDRAGGLRLPASQRGGAELR